MFPTFSKSKQKKLLKKEKKMVELKPLTELPKCEDGRACKNENQAFIVINCLDPKTGQTGLKAFCYDCYKQAEKEKNQVLIELYGKINKVE